MDRGERKESKKNIVRITPVCHVRLCERRGCQCVKVWNKDKFVPGFFSPPRIAPYRPLARCYHIVSSPSRPAASTKNARAVCDIWIYIKCVHGVSARVKSNEPVPLDSSCSSRDTTIRPLTFTNYVSLREVRYSISTLKKILPSLTKSRVWKIQSVIIDWERLAATI